MPTTLFANARFYTMDPNRPLVEALAVRDGRILAVGALPKVRGQLEGPFRTVDLGGLCTIPAFTDAHIHLASYCLRQAEVDLSAARSVGEATALIRRKADVLPPGSWVRGGGWDKNTWPGAGFPTAADIDAVCPDRPVAVSSKDGHALWVNTVTLNLGGIGPGTGDPPGGEIVRRDGVPTGVLLERAMEMVYSVMPPVHPDEIRKAITVGQASLHTFGITAVHVPEGPTVFKVLMDLYAAGQLGLRTYMMIPADESEHALQLGLRSGVGDDMLRIGPVKIFADGALGPQTAHLLAPYETRPGYHGLEVTPAEEIKQLVRRCAEGGLASAVHAIGDAATRSALGAFQVAARIPWQHRVEHAQLVAPEDMSLFTELSVTASVQPCHLLSDSELIDYHWGGRGRYAFPFRTLIRSGANVAFGSDAPVEPVDPLRGVYAAVTRERSMVATAKPWYPEECLEVVEAVRAYTLGPARAEALGPNRGVFTEGMWADLTVLSGDIFEEPEALPHTRVLATFKEGEPVHDTL